LDPFAEVRTVHESLTGLSAKELLEKERAWRLKCMEISPAVYELHGTSDYQKALNVLGYNILPDLMNLIRKETNSVLRWEFAEQVPFPFYRYSRSHRTREGDFDYFDAMEEPAPFLSIEVDPNTNALMNRDIDKASMLVQWWDQREAFLKRDGAPGKLREILGRTPEEYAAFDMQRWRKLEKCFFSYGIYNIPYFVEVIAEDNNPILFCEFLRMCCIERYRELNPVPGIPHMVVITQNAYPAQEDNTKVICAWWEENADKFTRLEDLHEAIESVLKQHCAAENS